VSHPYSFIYLSPLISDVSNWRHHLLWHVPHTHEKVNLSCLKCFRQQFTSPDIFPNNNLRLHNLLVKHIRNKADVRFSGMLCSLWFPAFRNNLSVSSFSRVKKSKKNAGNVNR
jgi:hypothetical protein